MPPEVRTQAGEAELGAADRVGKGAPAVATAAPMPQVAARAGQVVRVGHKAGRGVAGGLEGAATTLAAAQEEADHDLQAAAHLPLAHPSLVSEPAIAEDLSMKSIHHPSLESSTLCSRSRAGSALMLMIWALLLMSMVVMGLVQYLNFSASEAVIDAAEFRALHLAESGLAVGLHPSTRRGDKVLKQKIGTDSGFDVVINYEGARIPINLVTDERLREAVYGLFMRWGLNGDEASIAAESLADWVDRNEEARANGAEKEYYEGLGVYDLPRNTGFTHTDEMLLVRGMGVVDRLKPDWREYFSVYGDGTIDLRTAFKETLIAIAGAAEKDVESFILKRDGADGIPGTEDDQRLSDSESYRMLGLTGDRARELQGILTSEDDLRRITSTGYVGEKRKQIIVVARRGEDRSLSYLARIEE